MSETEPFFRYLLRFFSVMLDCTTSMPFHVSPASHEELYDMAMQHYLQAESNPVDERYSFKASTATIVKTEESGGYQHQPLSLTIFARNPHGEYFMYSTTSPFAEKLLKHVSHRMARVVLGDAYLEPGVEQAD